MTDTATDEAPTPAPEPPVAPPTPRTRIQAPSFARFGKDRRLVF